MAGRTCSLDAAWNGENGFSARLRVGAYQPGLSAGGQREGKQDHFAASAARELFDQGYA